MSARPCAGIVLAGGASSRMGAPKAALRLPGPPGGGEGPTFAEALVAAFSKAGLAPILLVTGCHRVAPPPGAREVFASDWSQGMRASLRAAAVALAAEAPERCALLTHIDRPFVSQETLTALLAAPPIAADAVPYQGGRPAHPVRLGPATLRRLLLPDDTPLAELLAASGAVAVPVTDPQVHLNLNTPEALAAVFRKGVLSDGS